MSATPIDRAVVQDAYDQAALAVSRIRSGAMDDEYWNDDDTLAYYEGRRDALKALLEPPNEPDPRDE